VARVPLWDAFKSTLPMLGLLVALLGLITYVPAVTLWLPHLLQGGNP
jgi:C4-dicarboxylate transporter DctM subunit